jgi:alcohol dehydrogenase
LKTEVRMDNEQFRGWTLPRVGAALELRTYPIPELHPAGVLVEVESAMVLSYMAKVLDGSIPYAVPPPPFIPGTNAIGVVKAVGAEVSHVAPGERVFLSPHLVANEPSGAAPQILIGLTALGSSRFDDVPEGARRLQRIWPHGVFAELAHWPACCATPLRGLDRIPREQLIALAKLVVPFGGLLRAGAGPGLVVAINGASGFYGSAGVMLALALGASRVVAIGRDASALASLGETLGSRVATAVVSGEDLAGDVAAIHEAAGGKVDVALDLLGGAASTSTTLATLRSLRRGGRLVLMGSASAPLELTFGEMLSNDWEVIGNFMYPASAPRRLTSLVRSGQLDLAPIRLRRFPFSQLPSAIQSASSMRGLDLTALETERA